MSEGNWRPRPEIPRSHSYEMAYCKDPNCGLHLIAKDEHGNDICEIVMSPAQTLKLISFCKKMLYEKAI